MQILGQAKDPAVIQAHLKKLFAGVHGVALNDSKDAITAALSVEAEQVQLATAVPVSDQVESWLQSLLSGMQTTLQVILPLGTHTSVLTVRKEVHTHVTVFTYISRVAVKSAVPSCIFQRCLFNALQC